jgi:hypothetical protein
MASAPQGCLEKVSLALMRDQPLRETSYPRLLRRESCLPLTA